MVMNRLVSHGIQFRSSQYWRPLNQYNRVNVKRNILKSSLYNISIGFACASFWRGAWYIFDELLYPDDIVKSSLASLLLGSAGIITSQTIPAFESTEVTKKNRTIYKRLWSIIHKSSPVRLYSLALSCVLVWRGAWVGWDVLQSCDRKNYDRFLNDTVDYCSKFANNIISTQGQTSQNMPKKGMNFQHRVESSAFVRQLSCESSPTLFSYCDNLIYLNPSQDYEIDFHKIASTSYFANCDKDKIISAVFSHAAGVIILFGVGSFASVLSPPAIPSITKKQVLIRTFSKQFR